MSGHVYMHTCTFNCRACMHACVQVRASMLASAPTPPDGATPVEDVSEASALLPRSEPQKRTRAAHTSLNELSHPLLGDQPTLRLMPDPGTVKGE